MRLIVFIFFLPFIFIAQNKTDASGKKQGYWKKKDEKTGSILYEGTFKDDKPTGYFKHYYPGDTARRSVTYYKDGGKVAYTKMYYQLTGKLMAEGKYVNEKKDSIWLYYDDAGVLLSKESFKNGKKEGLCLVYLPDGAIAEEKNFKDDLPDGPWKQYFDGKLLKAEGNYVKGKFDGKVSYYYPGGVAAATGIYKNGCREGVWLYKDKDGKITSKEVWKNCKQLSDKEAEAFLKKGKEAETKTTQDNKKPVPNKGQGKTSAK